MLDVSFWSEFLANFLSDFIVGILIGTILAWIIGKLISRSDRNEQRKDCFASDGNGKLVIP